MSWGLAAEQQFRTHQQTACLTASGAEEEALGLAGSSPVKILTSSACDAGLTATSAMAPGSAAVVVEAKATAKAKCTLPLAVRQPVADTPITIQLEAKGQEETPDVPSVIKSRSGVAVPYPPGLALPPGTPSRGSSLHVSGECRPCPWFWKPEGCQNMGDCGYCHLCPEGELKARKKAKQAMMRLGLSTPKPAKLSANSVPDAARKVRFSDIFNDMHGESLAEEPTTPTPCNLTQSEPVSIFVTPPHPQLSNVQSFFAGAANQPVAVVPKPAPKLTLPLTVSREANFFQSPAPRDSLGVGDPIREPATITPDAAIVRGGSALHAKGECQPCAWFYKPRGCQNGLDCSYCHLCPDGELKARKKTKQALMRMGLDTPKAVVGLGGEAPERSHGAFSQEPAPSPEDSEPESTTAASGSDEADDNPRSVDSSSSGLTTPERNTSTLSGGTTPSCNDSYSIDMAVENKDLALPPGAKSREGLVVPIPPGLQPPPTTPSHGSILHGTGNCQPCAWFWKSNSCQNGKDCGFCHLCPEGELKSRKKNKQAMMRLGLATPVDTDPATPQEDRFWMSETTPSLNFSTPTTRARADSSPEAVQVLSLMSLI